MGLNVGRGQFSLVFASFFGAAMIAAAFAYSNYRFSQYKFIDFSQSIFYTKDDIFTPKYDEFIVVIYSSNMQNFDTIKSKISKEYPIVAIDMFQQKRGEIDGVLYIWAGMNTLLQVVQRFNVVEIPSNFKLKRYRGSNFKQDSLVKVIE